MRIRPKRKSMPCHWNSSNTPCSQRRIILKKKWPSLMPCIQTPHCFYLSISLHLDVEAINFQGNETHLSDFPASSFILGAKKISLTGLNVAVSQYM